MRAAAIAASYGRAEAWRRVTTGEPVEDGHGERRLAEAAGGRQTRALRPGARRPQNRRPCDSSRSGRRAARAGSASCGTAARSCCSRRTTGSPRRSTSSRRTRSAGSSPRRWLAAAERAGRLDGGRLGRPRARCRPAARPARRRRRRSGERASPTGAAPTSARRAPASTTACTRRSGRSSSSRPRPRGASPPASPSAAAATRRFTAAEPEIAIVLGRRGTILGFTLANDVSAWDIERDNPLYLPQSKVYTGCFAFGPVIVTPDEIPDPYAIALRCRVLRGGREVFAGEATTGQLKRRFEELVGWLAALERDPHRDRPLDRHRHHPAARRPGSRRATWSSSPLPSSASCGTPWPSCDSPGSTPTRCGPRTSRSRRRPRGARSPGWARAWCSPPPSSAPAS